MLKLSIQIKDQCSLYAELPNDKAKKLWKHIEKFFRNNSMASTFIMFGDQKDVKKHKGTQTNFIRATKKANTIEIYNTMDKQFNKRFMRVKICACETKHTCKCKG